MTERKLEKVQDRMAKDYKELVEQYLKNNTKQEIIDDAYRIAHYNEVVDFFDNIDYVHPPFGDYVFDHILKSKDNVILRVWNNWLNYSHSEYYNFFNYESLSEIIEWTFRKNWNRIRNKLKLVWIKNLHFLI